MNVDENEIDQVFSLAETAVSQTELVARISQNLKQHQLKSPTTWSTFTLAPHAPNDSPSVASELRRALDNATKMYDNVWLTPAILASDSSLTARLKRPFHQLSVFYVNKIGQKQIRINDRLLRVIHHLVTLHEEKEQEIQNLRQQLTSLEQRLAKLEKDRP